MTHTQRADREIRSALAMSRAADSEAAYDSAERHLAATLSSIARAADGATTLRQLHLSGIALELEKQRRAIALVRET